MEKANNVKQSGSMVEERVTGSKERIRRRATCRTGSKEIVRVKSK